MLAAVLRMHDPLHLGLSCRQRALKPHAAVGVHHVRCKLTYASRERARVNEAQWTRRLCEVKPRGIAQSARLSAEMAQTENMTIEDTRVCSSDELHDQTLQPSFIEVQHHVKDPNRTRTGAP